MPGLEPWFPQPESRADHEGRPNPGPHAVPAPHSAQPPAPHSAQPPAIIWPVERAPDAIAAFEREDLPPPPNAKEILARLVRNALILVENGEVRLAAQLLRNALMRDARHPQALRWMSFCLKQIGDLDGARKCAQALAQTRPDEDASWFLLGEIHYECGRDEDARQAFSRALTLARADCPFLFDIYKYLGNASVRAGDFDAAEESYNKAFALNPRSDVLMVNYGTLEIQREQLEAAVERFRAAVELNPENDKAWIGLALVHRHKGDAALANANLERALDVAPGNRTGLRLAIDWGAQDRDFSSAVRRLQDYLAINGEDAEMSLALAQIFAATNRAAEAKLEAERAASLDPRLREATALLDAIRKEERDSAAQAAEAR